MSLEEKLQEHWDVITRKMQTIQEALTWSVSGQKVTEQSMQLAECESMLGVLQVLSKESIPEMERFKMSQYFAQALETNPEKNMQGFETYLGDIGKDERYPNRAWYLEIQQAVAAFKNSQSFRDYIMVYKAFQQDASEDASDARRIIERVSKSLREIVEKVG